MAMDVSTNGSQNITNTELLYNMTNFTLVNSNDNTTVLRELQHPPLLKSSLPLPLTIFLCLAYTIVLLLALVNNSLVLAVIYRNQQMRSVTNYFLANLAVADITVSFIVLPVTLLSNIFSEWWFGSFLCKAIPYLQAVAVGASVNTLGAVAVERYFAIFRPQDRIITPQRALVTIAVLWIFPSIIQIPWILYSDVRTISNATYTMTVCYQQFPSLQFQKGFFLGVMFFTCYLIPLCFMSVFYFMIGIKVWRRNVGGIRGSQADKNIQKCKIRIVRMLVTVAVVFASFWIPLYATRILILQYGRSMPPARISLIRDILTPLFQWLGSATSAVNPFIYCYFSVQFRKYISELLPKSHCSQHTNKTEAPKKKNNDNNFHNNKQFEKENTSESAPLTKQTNCNSTKV